MFQLVGLPEGLVGASIVYASSVDEVFEKFPILKTVREKLTIQSNRIIGKVDTSQFQESPGTLPPFHTPSRVYH
jgi:hypothetical protein